MLGFLGEFLVWLVSQSQCVRTVSYVGQFELFGIVHIGNGGLALSHHHVVHDVVGQQASLCVCACI